MALHRQMYMAFPLSRFFIDKDDSGFHYYYQVDYGYGIDVERSDAVSSVYMVDIVEK